MSPRHNQFFIVVALLFVIIFQFYIGSAVSVPSYHSNYETNTFAYPWHRRFKYIRRSSLYIQWKFAPKKQTNAFLRGLHELIPLDLLRASFDEKELELLVCGIHELNVKEWRANTIVKDENISPHSSSEFLEWFWEVVEEFDNEKRTKLLEYVTGSPSLPVGGFAILFPKFTIELQLLDKNNAFVPPPTAHTCATTILLPFYDSKATLEKQLNIMLDGPLKFDHY